MAATFDKDIVNRIGEQLRDSDSPSAEAFDALPNGAMRICLCSMAS